MVAGVTHYWNPWEWLVCWITVGSEWAHVNTGIAIVSECGGGVDGSRGWHMSQVIDTTEGGGSDCGSPGHVWQGGGCASDSSSSPKSPGWNTLQQPGQSVRWTLLHRAGGIWLGRGGGGGSVSEHLQDCNKQAIIKSGQQCGDFYIAKQMHPYLSWDTMTDLVRVQRVWGVEGT